MFIFNFHHPTITSLFLINRLFNDIILTPIIQIGYYAVAKWSVYKNFLVNGWRIEILEAIKR